MNKLYVKYRILFLFILAIWAGNGKAQSVVPVSYDASNLDWNTSQYQSFKYVSNSAAVGEMTFRILFPAGYSAAGSAKYPTILMLHGRGEGQRKDANGNFVLDNNYHLIHGGKEHLNAVNNGKFPGIVIFPQSQYGYWVGNQGAPNEPISQPMKKVLEMMDYLIKIHAIDPDRIYVHGLSGGASGVWDALWRRPELFAAALPMSNAGHLAQVSNVYRNPVWLFQGETDVNPRPFASEAMIAALKNAGGTPRYKMYPGVGHGTWYFAYAEPDFFSWMLQQNKLKIHVANGLPQVCKGQALKLGISPGFAAYEWSTGDTTNDISVTDPGTYSVRFKRANGVWSDWSEAVNVVNGPVAAKLSVNVTGTTALAPSGGGVTLTASSGMDKYLWSSNATTQSIIVSTPGTYSVQGAMSTQCYGDPSDPVIVTRGPSTTPFASPTNLTGVSNSYTTVDLSWQDNTPDETKFEVWQSNTNSGYQFVAALNSNTTNYKVTGLVYNTSYYFVVRAINNTGYSGFTNSLNIKTKSDLTAPTAPSNLEVTGNTPNSMILKWSASTDDIGVSGYNVYMNNTLVGTSNLLSDTITGLSLNTNYTFYVRAFDANNNLSAFSNVITKKLIQTNGVFYSYYEGTWTTLPNFTSLNPIKQGIIPNFSLSPAIKTDRYGFTFDAYINIPTSGSYIFYTSSDAGSKLYIDDQEIVNNDGVHSSRERSGTITLSAGMHRILVTYFETTGSESLSVRWNGPNFSKQLIPNSVLYTITNAEGTFINTAPEIIQIADITMNTGSSQSVKISATDSDNDPVSIKAFNLPSFAAFTNNSIDSGMLNLNPGDADTGVYNSVLFVADDNMGGLDSMYITIRVNKAWQPVVLYRINAGGGNLTAANLNWSADTREVPTSYLDKTSSNNTGGSTSWNGSNTTGAPNQIFGPFRFDGPWGGPMMYNFPVNPGTYTVNLYFAENPYGTVKNSGQRIFNVSAEGTVKLNNLDVYSEAALTALKKSFTVTVDDTILDLDFAAVLGDPFVNGIEIISAQTTLGKRGPGSTGEGMNPDSVISDETDPFETQAISIEKDETQVNYPTVYPNPLKGTELTMEFPESMNGKVIIALYDQMGRELYYLEHVSEYGKKLNIDLSSVEMIPGTYFLKFSGSSGEQVLKLLKNR